MRTIGGTLGVVLVRAYQLVLGPFMGGGCRFTPSCSTYAIDAFTQHGFWRGGWFALRRIGRCHPFAHPGVDPVPDAEGVFRRPAPPAGPSLLRADVSSSNAGRSFRNVL